MDEQKKNNTPEGAESPVSPEQKLERETESAVERYESTVQESRRGKDESPADETSDAPSVSGEPDEREKSEKDILSQSHDEKKPGSKNSMKKGLIIAIIVLAVAAALVALLLLLPDAETEPSESPGESLEPIETRYLVNEQYSKLDKIEIYDRDGKKTHTITSADDGEGGREFSISPSREGWNYDQDAFRATAINASTMSALSLVAENPSDLGQYELDKPYYKIKLEFADGARKYEILVGGPTALSDSYYCSCGDGNVYAVGAYTINQLIRAEMEYRTYEFFPDYYDSDALEVVTDGAITYVRARDEQNNYDLLVRKVEDGEFENAQTDLYMEKPIESFATDDAVEDYLINVAVLIKVTDIVIDDPTPEQLSEYGFDTPREVWLKNDDGDEVYYRIGTTAGSNGYVMVNDVETIFTAENISDALFSLNYTDLIFKLLLGDNIRDISDVYYSLPDGSNRRLQLEFEEATEENASGTVIGSLDGEAISSQNASRLYTAALNLQIYEAYDKEANPVSASRPDVTIRVVRKDGGEHTLELVKVNERRYAAFLDGAETGYYVHRDTVKVLTDAFGYVDRGETIPRI